MPPSSDPFDDYDLDFDPATLKEIEALEKRASSVSATQTKKYHHTVAKPAKARPKPPPRPINTNPRTSGCGMGWEPGGKHYTKFQPPPLASQKIDEESLPVDVVADADGRYMGASQDEVIDQRTRPEIREMVESAARQSAPPPLPGSQARREAIFSAMAEAGPGPSTTAASRQFQRANSSSAVPSATAAKIGANRALARSISTGSNVFNRAPPAQTTLPPIAASQGSQSSQGSAARRVAGELEDERRKREASDAEVRALKAQIAQLQASSTASAWANGTTAGGADDPEIAALKQQLWTAQGQAATAKRNQETMVAKLQEELEKARTQNQRLEAEMGVRERDMKQKLESMRTQAVFSNHNAMASASKARHQSQWSSSQRPGAPTPMRGSPLKEKNMMTPAPLTRSVKGKERPPPPPPFGQLQNAFARTPATSSRKRQRTEVPSPNTTPRKAQQYSSPAVSPVRSHGGDHVASDGDVGMDWQPDFGFGGEANVGGATVMLTDRDTKTEIQHHLLSHSAFTPMATFSQGCQPSIFRLMTSEPPQEELVSEWQKQCNSLLALIHNNTLPYDDGFCERLLGTLVRLVEVAVHCTFQEHLEDARHIDFLPTLIILLRLVSSTILIFPSFIPGSHSSTGPLEVKILEVSYFLTGSKVETVNEWWKAALVRLSGEEDPKTSWEDELADAVVEVGEALCLNSSRNHSWSSNCLSELILNLAQSERQLVVGRALDLFAIAACRDEFFRALLFPPDGFQGGAPVIDRVSRFLVTPPPEMPKAQVYRRTISVLAGLFVLSRNNPDAVVLLSEKSVLVPSLLMLLYRESTSIWGIRTDAMLHDTLSIVLPTLQLLHHLVYPAPLPRPESSLATPTKDTEVTPQGVDLARKLQEPGEWNGLSHIFVSTLGGIAYADIDVDDGAWAYAALVPKQERARKMDLNDVRLMQFLAQDLLERVVEGPEGDSVFEVFAESQTAESQHSPAEPEEEEDYDEEERVMDAWPGMDED